MSIINHKKIKSRRIERKKERNYGGFTWSQVDRPYRFSLG
jgi:hypothetical protein